LASEDENFTRYTLRLGPEAMETVNWIKKKRQVSNLTEVFRRAIATEKFLLESEEQGDVIILEDKSGKQRILHLT
jgi:hypothetical protein